jgi:predicted peptidase
VYLHGAGNRGSDLEVVRGVVRDAFYSQPNLPCVLVAPQCPLDDFWHPVVVADLLNEVSAKYRIDADRVYITGMSMGGYGAWAMATAYPERLAAVVPLCGGGDPAEAARMKDLPIWDFHGDRDDVVPIRESQALVEALQQAGGRVRFTVFKGAGHSITVEAYDTEGLFPWLLAQRRGAPAEPSHPTSRPASQPAAPPAQ